MFNAVFKKFIAWRRNVLKGKQSVSLIIDWKLFFSESILRAVRAGDTKLRKWKSIIH